MRHGLDRRSVFRRGRCIGETFGQGWMMRLSAHGDQRLDPCRLAGRHIQDAAVKAAIAAIPEGEWKTFRDGEIAETVHCMNKTDKAFRLIVMRRPREQDLFED